MSERTIAAMCFQGTPLGGGYSVDDLDGVGWLGRRCGSIDGVGCACTSYTQFTMAGSAELGIPRDCFLVSFLESIPLSSRRLQLTSAGFPARYRLSTPRYRSLSRLAMSKSGIFFSIVAPFVHFDMPWTRNI